MILIVIWDCFLLARESDQITSISVFPKRIDAIVLHTYQSPRWSSEDIPFRGKIVLRAAWLLARVHHCLLVIPAGRVNKQEMQGVIYCKFAIATFGDSVRILTGENPEACDTAGEVGEALRILQNHKAQRVVVVGLAPHIVRIHNLWKKAQTDGLAIFFFGERGPIRYYPWETLMIIMESLLPIGSRRRALALKIRRKV